MGGKMLLAKKNAEGRARRICRGMEPKIGDKIVENPKIIAPEPIMQGAPSTSK
jgi:hypothetical protein